MLSIIIILIVIAIDQLSKIACANALKLGESVEIIKGVFSIAYVTDAWYSILERRKYSVMNGRSSTKLICSASAASRQEASSRAVLSDLASADRASSLYPP